MALDLNSFLSTFTGRPIWVGTGALTIGRVSITPEPIGIGDALEKWSIEAEITFYPRVAATPLTAAEVLKLAPPGPYADAAELLARAVLAGDVDALPALIDEAKAKYDLG